MTQPWPGSLGGLLGFGSMLQGIPLSADALMQQGIQMQQSDLWQAQTEAMKKAWLTTREAVFGKPLIEDYGNFKVVMPPDPFEKRPHAKWLHERLETTLTHGREWLTSGRTVAPKEFVRTIATVPISAEMKAKVGTGIPTKRLLNGDLVYVYPEDHHVQPEVLDKWTAKNHEWGGM
jgi:hypothetical protein